LTPSNARSSGVGAAGSTTSPGGTTRNIVQRSGSGGNSGGQSGFSQREASGVDSVGKVGGSSVEDNGAKDHLKQDKSNNTRYSGDGNQWKDELWMHASNHPQIPGRKPLRYGTAGFRSDASELDSCVFRMGVLSAMRSRMLGGQPTGLVITASHNPEKDNGIKLVDPSGDMLLERMEAVATRIENSEDIVRRSVLDLKQI
jgi:hypothetical protein